MSEIIQFEKIVPEGNALGRKDGKVVFCAGVLPGELAEVEIVRDKKSYAKARLLKVLEKSAERSETSEDHALSCSPWQGVSYKYQLKLKQEMLMEAFKQQKLEIGTVDIAPSSKLQGFRNRLDFVLTQNMNKTKLGFHVRGSANDLVLLPEGCRLGTDAMNKAALRMCAKLDELGVAKAQWLTVRQSEASGNVLVWASVSEKEPVDYAKLQISGICGLIVTMATPAPLTAGKVIFEVGESQLTEELGGQKMAYPFDGFFQTHIGLFKKALSDIEALVPAGAKVADLYAGAGAIGLALAKKASKVIAVETAVSSVGYAKHNAETLKLDNFEVLQSSAENVETEFLKEADCVIVDPPRSGMDPQLVNKLLEALPAQVIYLSCNPVTQARDVALLKMAYDFALVGAYDFYPGTPHLESLVELKLR